MAIKNIYNTEISAPSFTWNGNTIATQAWVNANVGTPTLDSVTTSGSVTTNNLSVGSLNVTGGTIVSGVDTRTNVGIAIAKGDYLTSNDGSYIRNLIGLNSSSNIEIGQSGTSLISNIQLKPGSNGNIQFYASGSEDVRINSSGNVGIGTTSPAGRLELNGSGQSWSTAPAIRMWDSFNSKGWLVGNVNNITAGDFYIRTLPGEDTNPGASNNEFTIKHATGNVGIGTTTPAQKLDVNGIIAATGGNSTNWNTAYGWGDHASAGYLTSVPSHQHTDADINSWHNRQTINIDTYNPDSNWSTSIATSTSYGTQPNNYTNIHNLGGDGVDFQTQIATYYGNNNRMWVRSRYDGTNAWLSWNEVWTSGSFANNSANWDTAYGWGDHSAAGYLTSYTETDPVFSASAAAGITSTNISNWNTAYGWGDHAAAGYLTTLPAHDHNKITEQALISYGQGFLQWTDLNGLGGTGLSGSTPENPFNDWHHHIIMNHANSNGYYVDMAFSFHNDRVHFRRKAGSTPQPWLEFWHTGNISTTQVSNWDTAYGWGDHSAAGYLTSYSETDTLATVVARGAFFGTTDQGYVASGGTYGTELRKIKRITLTRGDSNWNSDNHAILSKGLSGADADSISINSYNGIHLRLDSNNNNANSTTNFTIHNDTTTSSNELFRITGDGNVGIGTTTPTEKLSVATNTDASAEIGRAHVGSMGHVDYAGFSHIDQNGTGSYSLLQSATGTTFLNSATGKPINFRIANSDKMVLSSAGNLGVGTTSPSEKLHVAGNAWLGTIKQNTGTILQRVNSSWTNNTTTDILYNAWTASTGDYIALRPAGNQTSQGAFVAAKNGAWFGQHASTGAITDSATAPLSTTWAKIAATSFFNGNVGIGTTSPNALLHVYSTGNGEIEVERASGALFNIQSQSALATLGTDSNHPLYLKTNGGTRVAITTAGNVGIGTTSPSRKLQVGGGSADDRIRVYFNDGTYSEQTGYGMEFARGVSYLRPNNNNARTLNIGSSGLAWSGVNVESTNFTWNSNAVATQSWVTSQGYSTSSATVYTPDVYEWGGGLFNASGAPIDIAGPMVNGTTTTSQVSPSEIQFTAAGTYMISWSLNWESLYANRSVFGAGAYLNGNIIPGSSNLQYFRYNTYGHASTTNATFSVQVAANDVISWRTLLHSGVVNHATTPIGGDMGVITIHRIA